MPTEDLSYLSGADPRAPPHPHQLPHHRRYYSSGGVDGKVGGSPPPGGPPMPPRTTALSRRGGRTRSRSPPVVVASGGRRSSDPPSTPPPPMSSSGQLPDNPSSAAAAAAAAAKAFSSGGSNRHRHRGDEPALSGGGYRGGGPYGGGGHWPGGPPSDDPHRRGGGGSYRYGSSSTGGDDGGGFPPHRGGGSYYHRGGGIGPDGRPYGERDSTASGSRGHHHMYDPSSSANPSSYRGSASSQQHPPPHHRYPPDYHRYGRDAGGHASASKISRGSGSGHGGGTSLVIGGTTPIHVPKPLEASSPLPPMPSSGRSHRGGSASSVFRGRPGDGGDSSAAPGSVAPGGAGGADDDSPQKILLSLRTPTSSFEEGSHHKGPDHRAKKAGHTQPLSPDDPPAIQNNANQRPSDPLFDRSPEVHKLAASIENAPSFSLFNQSFDSFGDGHYFNVDATLQNDSFGMVRAASVDADVATQILQSTSVGNFSQQLLASGSGALTLGYSPVNSFGNVSASGTNNNGNGGPASRRSSSILVVGGTDGRATSPTQVLGMYRSYSGGGAAAPSRPVPASGGPLDDSHLRMSMGSFGAPSMAFSRSYGAEPTAAPSSSSYYYPGPSRTAHEAFDNSPPFHSFLRRHQNAFKDCMFLLPGLKAALLEAPRSDSGDVRSSPTALDGTNKTLPSPLFGAPSPQDTAIARRRVECSIFAFGGNPNRDLAVATSSPRAEKSTDRSSIFRGKDDANKTKAVASSAATVTPSSNTSPAASRHQSRAKTKYEDGLPGRYYENESRLSWEFEESPPVEISRDEDNDSEREDGNGNSKSSVEGDSNDQDHQSRQDGDESYCKPVGDSESASKRTTGSPQPKMRYRCKLCGQPKQNHTCPYQQSLARSIGVMVFPAVNAFTAAEPGTIAPALSDMNNFIDVQKESGSNESSPNRPTPDRPHRRITTSGTVASTTQVTPESMRSSPRQIHSPISFATTPGPSPTRRGGIMRSGGVHVSGRKRSYGHVMGSEEQCDLLFLEAMEIKSEQFRLVSPVNPAKSPDAYNYPSLPLPYAQRKRLSDNLFSLSNEVPKLTDECAQVLREAREKDMWDLAVAELMTQVIVIIHCPEGDNRFEGLRQYLLTLGIAC